MSEITNILNQFAESMLPDLRVASKRFADSIESEVSENGNGASLIITGSQYIRTLIDGRKPTRIDAVKGDPTLQEILLEWIKQKGISPIARANGKTPTTEQLSWAMAQSMHKKGDLLYQRGGGNDIFSGIITPSRLDSLFSVISESYFIDIESQVTKVFKNGSNNI